MIKKETKQLKDLENELSNLFSNLKNHEFLYKSIF